MEIAELVPDSRSERPASFKNSPRSSVQNAVYAMSLAVSVAVWLIAICAPLWLDETGSFSQISEGIAGIWSRRGGVFPGYLYILWAATKVLGTNEVALRIPSVVAMLAAVYMLFRTARELFGRETALVVVLVFCLHPIVAFEAIDARPYAFGALALDAALFTLVRLRRSKSTSIAVLLGALAATVLYFQILHAVVLPALALVFIVLTIHDRKIFRRQATFALSGFVLAGLPAMPGLIYIFETRRTHLFEKTPRLIELLWTIAPGWLALIAGLALLFATATKQPFVREPVGRWRVLLCFSVAFVPLLILYGVSVATPIHIFVARYRMVAIPGIALCWALLISRINSRTIRTLFCAVFVTVTAYHAFTSPDSRTHGYTWKYALAAAEQNASPDNAPVLICSDLPESDYAPMPLNSAKDSNLFAPLTYYKLSVPVVPLPRSLNTEAVRVASSFLEDAAPKHQRFLALAWKPSYPTITWIVSAASPTYQSHTLAVLDGVEVVEFTPRMGSH